MARPANPSSGQPLFTPVSHPELRRLGRKQVHSFLREREKYLLRIKDAQDAGSTITPVSLRSSIDRDLLESLISLNQFNDVKELDNLTDEILEKWLQKKDGVKLESVSLTELEAAVKASVSINVKEPDPELRILSLFADYKTLLRNKKWERLIDDSPKIAIQHVTSLLKPSALRKKIEQDIKLNIDNIKEDWVVFFEKVSKRAIDCDEYVSIFEGSSTDRSKQVDSDDDGPRRSRKDHGQQTRKSRDGGGTKSSESRDKESTPPSEKRSGDKDRTAQKELPDCLNPDCDGKHYVKDCADTSEELRKQLMKEYYEKKRGKGRQSAVRHALSVDDMLLQHPRSGCFAGVLADVVPCVVNGDYGSDHAAFSERHLEQLANSNVYVQVLPLKEPITMGLAMESQDQFTARKKAKISITINSRAGPFRFRNLPFLVCEEDMPEVLLSRPLLQNIGFDLDKHLTIVRPQYHDADFSHVGFAEECNEQPGKLSALLRSVDPQSEALPSETTTQAFDDPISIDEPIPQGKEDRESTRVHLRNCIKEAIDNGLAEEFHQELKDLVWEYEDIFRTKIGDDPPADIAPMRVKLKHDATPVRVKARRYAPPQAAFLRNKVDELERTGFVRVNNTSRWASAPLIVPKEGPEQFRFTVDLRPINHYTEPHLWPMPDLETISFALKGDTCFASLDMCQGYWQIPLAEEAQELHSFITPDGVYSPTRVLHGATNAASYFQSEVQMICKPVRDKLLQWIDDMLMHCKNARELLTTLRKLFELFRLRNLKLHAKKCKFYLEQVRWCGRIISKDGIRFDPSRFQALLDIEEPVTAADLQQFVCAAKWMRTAVPEFNKLITPLAELLEEIYDAVGKRTRKAVSRVKISETSWDNVHRLAFAQAKQALHNSATLAHPDDSKILCLFTDASEHCWASVLTQIPPEDIDLEYPEQRHEPLAFLSGSFKGSQFNWSTPEKEAYAIVESVTRLDYMLLRPRGFHLFTDHKNLVFIFNPLAVYPKMSKHVYNKIERWSLRLSNFKYTIAHIVGEDNVWADLMSRWGATDYQKRTQLARSSIARMASLFRAPLAPDLDPDFTWPSGQEIKESQMRALNSGAADAPSATKKRFRQFEDGSTWIPADDTKLQLRICIIGHCGRGGHRGSETTNENIRDHFRWVGMKSDVYSFCNSCLHCKLTTGGNRIPRPMGHALHSDTPNEIIHFDYLYIFESTEGDSYILIIKDDASSLVWLHPCKATDAETTVEVLIQWFALFGVVLTWVSDRGSHFKNSVMQSLNRTLHAHHHFTTP